MLTTQEEQRIVQAATAKLLFPSGTRVRVLRLKPGALPATGTVAHPDIVPGRMRVNMDDFQVWFPLVEDMEVLR